METDSPRILVTGMTSLRPNAMEFENLGNYVIIEPLFRTLREEFKTSEIVTTLQLTENFAKRSCVRVLRDKRLWSYNPKSFILLCLDLVLSVIWAIIYRLFNLNLRRLIASSQLLDLYSESDVILFFSGDMFGDNALTHRHFLQGSILPLIAKLLNKKTYFIASSPGPFRSQWRTWLAKFTFEKFRLVATREPLSLYCLNFLGLYGDKYSWYPCPSVGFKRTHKSDLKELFQNEPLLERTDRPLVGLILGNINMVEPPLYKWPRDDTEYSEFVELVKHLVSELGLRVCIMSHQNRVDENDNLIPGPDHRVVEQLLELTAEECKPFVFALQRTYDASDSNRIIGCFDMLISGRIHGAVQGLSQAIPTSVIDYGSEPKAHKLKGFAMMWGVTEYLGDPTDATSMIEAASRLWFDRDLVREALSRRIPILSNRSCQLWKQIRYDFELP